VEEISSKNLLKRKDLIQKGMIGGIHKKE